MGLLSFQGSLLSGNIFVQLYYTNLFQLNLEFIIYE